MTPMAPGHCRRGSRPSTVLEGGPMPERQSSLACQACGARFEVHDDRWCCDCGGYLDLEFEARIDPAVLAGRPWGMWRYREAIPIDFGQEPVSFGEGATPLVPMNWEGRLVYVKLEMLFPTGSFKDRGASVAMTRAVGMGVRRVVEDSSGNAGCAASAYAALAGLDCEIFVPGDASAAKVSQVAAYGARVVRVEGTREDAARAARASVTSGTYYASHVWDPFFLHGTKTMAFEIWEQLGGLVPDMLLVPTGNGSLLLGAYLGFSDLRRQGLARRLPRLVGVQAAECAPLVRRFRDEPHRGAWGPTRADGIAVADPLRWKQILASVWDTGGDIVEVTEQQIDRAQEAAARRGLLIEPTSAAGLAAIEVVSPPGDACVVVPLTGHGLKSLRE